MRTLAPPTKSSPTTGKPSHRNSCCVTPIVVLILTIVVELGVYIQQPHLHALSRVVRVLAGQQVGHKLRGLDTSPAMEKQTTLERESERGRYM